VEGEKILMSQRQLQRWHVMGLVEGVEITLEKAEEKISAWMTGKGAQKKLSAPPPEGALKLR
jgi:hypothetical protein